MIDNGECWAVVLARAGSKGLPDKNIREFAGKPLLAWSIEQAESSQCIDRVIVSSDSSEYLDIASKHGAEGHFRKSWAANDDATNFDVLRDVLDLAPFVKWPEWLAVFQPTNPLRRDALVDEMALVACKSNAGMVLTVANIGRMPWWAWHHDSEGRLCPLIKAKSVRTNAAGGPRESVPDCFVANGNGWLCSTMFVVNGEQHKHGVVPIVEPYDLYHDIDTLDDFNRIERLFIAQKGLTNGSRTPIHADEYAYPD